MRIGIDCRMYSSRFTGIGRYVYELTENLFKIDSKNEYILFFNQPEYNLFQSPNPRVKKVLVNAKHYSFNEQTKFLHILNKQKLDLMHFTHFNAPIFYSKPSIVTIHDLTLHFFPGRKMTTPLHRLAYHITLKSAVKKAKKVITVSKNTKKDLQNLLKVPHAKIEVIYEGVHQKFHPISSTSAAHKIVLETKNKYNLNKPYLLYTGVWRTHKNIPNLLNAFHILKKDHNFDGYLVITGRNDPFYAKEIIDHARNLKLEKDVIFPGLVPEEDLVPLYNGALLYVFPSLYEGFGLSPLEAMQCGVPVVVSNSSCLPEICGHENALFFNPNDPQDIATKMSQAIKDPQLRQTLITNSLKHVKNFSWQKMAEQTLKVYNETP